MIRQNRKVGTFVPAIENAQKLSQTSSRPTEHEVNLWCGILYTGHIWVVDYCFAYQAHEFAIQTGMCHPKQVGLSGRGRSGWWNETLRYGWGGFRVGMCWRVRVSVPGPCHTREIGVEAPTQLKGGKVLRHPGTEQFPEPSEEQKVQNGTLAHENGACGGMVRSEIADHRRNGS